MAVTISTHNGSTVDLRHDKRDPWRIEEENRRWAEKHPGEVRIDTSKEHQILVDRGSLAQVYHELFDEALSEYNQKQIKTGHPERQIKNYLSHIQAEEGTHKSARHPIYEMITTIGSKEYPIDANLAKEILLEHARGFRERNPNLVVVCQALHGDEVSGGSILWHVHTAYIPIVTDQARGLRVQNSMKGALREQGIVGDKHFHTAQMIWEKKENQVLEEICNKHGLEVIHPQAGTKQEHLTVEEYRIKQQLKEAQENLEKVKNLPLGTTIVKKGRLEQLEEIERQFNADKINIDQMKRDQRAAAESMDAYLKAYTNLQKDKQDFDKLVNAAANKKISDLLDKALSFIRSIGLSEKFEAWKNDTVIEAKGIKR
ncbi:MAG: hypothetical protein IJ796_09200 [Lachnospiraceae bacterium]|nr:hypothetical protein [Lachnospiraceae bacterium]